MFDSDLNVFYFGGSGGFLFFHYLLLARKHFSWIEAAPDLAKSYTDQKALADIGNKPSAIPPATTNPQQAPDSLLAAQLGKMEEMLSVMKNQLFSFDKLVRMQS